MKFSESWLKEWVAYDISREALCAKLTMAGLEIEEVAAVAKPFTGIVVGKVLQVTPHPNADRLRICVVDVGQPEHLTIVCGASNVMPEMKVPVATIGAVLGDNFKIKHSKLRGIDSHGMICSASELGVAEESNGILSLPHDAPVGVNVREYMDLDDHIIDVAITPNRGDCLSLLGLATDIAAQVSMQIIPPAHVPIVTTLLDKLSVNVTEPGACPRYVGRIISHIDAHRPTPLFMQERLRRSGIRCINVVVDAVNYVMLELGQPMHAFDLAKLHGGVTVRSAQLGEKLALLNGTEVDLVAGTLIIADEQNPVAIAGVMGGASSGVSFETTTVFLESAYFNPQSVAASCRAYSLSSDSSYRFERSVDCHLQERAMDRLTELLLAHAGGEAGPLSVALAEKHLPDIAKIQLSYTKLTRLLGYDIPSADVEAILQRLGFSVKPSTDKLLSWEVTPPSRRPDITIAENVIQEVARIYGYDRIPTLVPTATLQVHKADEKLVVLNEFRLGLCAQGYNEMITYSFIDKLYAEQLFSDNNAIELLNPISADMSIMRPSLLPGLLNVLTYNQNRQQSRLKIFETGLCFNRNQDEITQLPRLGGLIWGTNSPVQWGIAKRQCDFFDIKGDIENLFSAPHFGKKLVFESKTMPAMHPGQCAAIVYDGTTIGYVGALHPLIKQELKLDGDIYYFEIDLEQLDGRCTPQHVPVSKFPEIRRDLALIIKHSIPAKAIQDTIKEVAEEWLKAVDIFDLYQGQGIAPDAKSLAVAITLQHSERTLVEKEVADLMERVVVALKGRFNAELRG